MEKEILRLYQERIDKYDEVFREVSRDIDQLKVSQRELTELQWRNNSLESEVAELRTDIADLHTNLIKERQNHLEVVAENDRLRIREHELERRVRVLANVSAKYYKEQDSAIHLDGTYGNSGTNTLGAVGQAARPPKRQRRPDNQQPEDQDEMDKDEFERKQLEIENETLQLSIETMRIQLQEQRANYVEIIEGLTGEFKAYRQVAAKEGSDRTRRVEDLETELARVKDLYRENLRDLVVARKAALESKHSVKQDSLLLRSEILTLQRRLDAEMERSRFLHSTSAHTESSYDD
ncbi:Coiled-coil domain-containing protein 77 [Coemansia pectinata]|uniref:Coiled-coil domain-containing protein 77 n=1 Tax=Coemansia pectinata TaxID=1052879 RepID=A0A9W8GX55_9FUNG|nr:Coiled-coil domain-containing protein 77 [Coemansia pectinata]